MKNKSRLFVKIALPMLGLLLAGCGVPKAGEYTDAGMTQIENGDYDQALADFEEAANRGENERLIARGKGIACYNLMDYESAVNCYLESLSYSDCKVDDLDFDINFYLADAYEKMGDYQSAIDTYNAILNLREDDVLACYNRGCDYLAVGNHDSAVSDFNKALTLDENNYDLRIEVAGRLNDYGYENEGVQLLQDFLTEKEKKLSDYDKGRIYYYMGDFENARIFLEEARDDDDQNTILYLGKTYEKLGDFNYAASVYDTFLKRHPESALIYNQLGLSKLEAGDYQGALDAFVAGMNIENNGIEQTLMFNEIVAYEYVGDFTQARSVMSTYLKKYPDDSAAQRENIFLASR